jgi:uncharacterized RDD family membrane protein YckC
MTVQTIVGAPPTRYAGLATRALGLAVDVAIAQVIVFAGGAVIALVFSLVGGINIDTAFEKLLAAAAWGLVVGFYFILFWSTAGQTPGMRLMALRVMDESRGHPGVWRSTVRLIALGLCIIPLCAGFIPVLFDDRRRGVHDMLARTVVVYAQE